MDKEILAVYKSVNPDEREILFRVEKANKSAETAFWWMKGIDRSDIDNLGVMSKIQNVIKLLREVDNITMDITIAIRNKSKQ